MLKPKNFKTKTSILMIAILICALFSGCSKNTVPTTSQPMTRTITDHAGRAVTIPVTINKVYYTSPLGMIMVYTLAPEKMAGTSMQFGDNEKKYLLPTVKDLPYLGGLQMNAKINSEELAKAKPDVIFSIGPPLSDTTISNSDKLQEQLNIPVIVLDGDITSTEKTLTFLGQMLGAEDRAQELIAYCNKTMQEITDITKNIPEDKKVRVYYAEGPKGLATEPKTSAHGLLLNIVNAQNVAEVEAKGGSGMSNVSLEQVLKWNPDVILSWGTDRGGAYDLILTSPDWKNISAVKNQKVYEVPNYPFNWFDRPPSVNRFLGLKWLTATLYPDIYKPDMVKEVKDFYHLFYHVDITDQDAKSLLKTSLH